MMAVVLISVGGAIGAVLRLVMCHGDGRVPWRMMAANVLASAAAAAFADLDDGWRWAVNVGVLGALSTWSSLAVSAAQLARADEKLTAAAVLLGTVAASVCAAALLL